MFRYRIALNVAAAMVTLLALGGAALAAEILESKPVPTNVLNPGAPVKAPRAGEILELKPGLTKLVKPDRTFRSASIGNPNLADVTVINLNTIAVTGKGIGATNLILFDNEGKDISNYAIQVVSGDDYRGGDDVEARHEVTVVRPNAKGGWENQSYLCASNCSPMNDKPPLSSNPPTGAPPSSTTTTTSNVNQNVKQQISGSAAAPAQAGTPPSQ